MGHIAPFTVRTLLTGDDNLDLTENKRTVTETLRFINDSKRFAWLPRICYVSFLPVFSLFIVNIPLLIFLLMSTCISSLLVWISIKCLKKYHVTSYLYHGVLWYTMVHCIHTMVHPCTSMVQLSYTIGCYSVPWYDLVELDMVHPWCK